MTAQMKMLYKRDALDRIPARWRGQYGQGYYLTDHAKQEIQKKLDALVIGKFMPEEVDAIIGNSGWTVFNCDLCDEGKDVLIQLGEEPDYDAQWVNCCRECLVKALAKF